MLRFTSFACLSQICPDHKARIIIHDMLHSLITSSGSVGHKYESDHEGYVVLIDQRDTERELDLFDPPTKLEDVFWEGTHIDRDFFVAVFVPNNQFTLVCIIENADWLPKNLRRALCACLVRDSH